MAFDGDVRAALIAGNMATSDVVIITVIAGRMRLRALTSEYILVNSTPPYVIASGMGIPFIESR